MSHTTKGQCRVTNLDDLELAAPLLGLRLVRGQRTWRWYGQFMNDSAEGRALASVLPVSQWGKCEHALQVVGHESGYEIGVVPALDGGPGYDLVFDGWGPGAEITKRCGADLGRLAAEVGAQAALRELARKGYRARVERTEKNLPRVVALKA